MLGPIDCITHYSLLTGLNKPDKLAARVAEFGYKTLGICDYNSIGGCVQLVNQCQKYNLKPIIGIRENDKKKGDWITKVTQIKEKFGGLRFYVTGTSDKNWKLIHKAEEKSLSVCEVTGSEVEVGTWNDGWIRTICRKEALRMFYDLSDKGEIKKSFDQYWKPKEKAQTIVTKKK